MDLVTIGKFLAMMGAALVAAGVTLPLENPARDIVIAAGALLTAISVYLAHTKIKAL